MADQFIFTLDIPCQRCVKAVKNAVKNALKELDFSKLGLSNQRIDLTKKKLFIDFDASKTQFGVHEVQQTMINTLEENGVIFKIDSVKKKPTRFNHWMFGGIGLLAGLGLMLLSVLTGGLSFPLMISLGAISAVLTVALGFQSFSNAYIHARFSQTMTMDTLFTISALTILGVSLAAFFMPGLPMMFEAGLMLFGFRHIGLGIEETLHKKTGVRRNFTDRIANTVWLKGGKEIKTSQIQPGDEISLNNGDMLPVDGSFVKTTPSIQNTIKTGNERRHKTSLNQIINAGAIIADKEQSYIFKASKTVDNSYLATLDNLLLSAQQSKAPIEYYTDKLLHYFIPVVLTIALLSGLAVGVWVSPILALQCAATVLVTACPCTLGMIVPMTMKIGMQKALKHGVAFQTREAVEQAAHINQVVFDLNGTLTQGRPKIRECIYEAHVNKPYLFQIVHLLEKDAKHPVGACLASYAKDQLKLTNDAFNWFSNIDVTELTNGRTATIRVNEQSMAYRIGNAQCMREQGIKIEEISKNPCIYLAENNQIMAKFIVFDPLRKGAAETIKQLQQNGKLVYLLTGSDGITARFYGEQLGIPQSNRFADKSPEDKQKQIRKYQKKGLIAMVGDGGNDALAMRQSDLGIAVYSPFGDTVSTQQAQVLIRDQSIFPVSYIFQIAKQTMSTLKQNLWFSLTYNATALLLTGGVLAAIGFAMNPAIGAALMVLQTSMILLNTYRLSYQKLSAKPPSDAGKGSSIATLSSLKALPVAHSSKPASQNVNTLNEAKKEMKYAPIKPPSLGHPGSTKSSVQSF